MSRTGTADLPLHGGHCPPWLFQRMQRLAGAILEAIVLEYGAAEVLRRLADPFWFQAFGNVLGFDWHSSGLTTTVCGAVKLALAERGRELGLFVAGGKGGAARKTPHEIRAMVERYGLPLAADGLARASRLAARVDTAAVQDGFDLYHHVICFTATGEWAVVQQGMQEGGRWARRYHWLSSAMGSFVEEPHAAICSDRQVPCLNLVDRSSRAARETVAALVQEPPDRVLHDYRRVLALLDAPPRRRPRRSREPAGQLALFGGAPTPDLPRPGIERYLALPAPHAVPRAEHLDRALRRVYEEGVGTFEALLGTPGVGAQAVRALAMVAEVVHGVPASFQDPVRYSFAHGGKDGHPYPVDRSRYDRSIDLLQDALDRARLGDREKLQALRRLATLGRAAPATPFPGLPAGSGTPVPDGCQERASGSALRTGSAAPPAVFIPR